MGKVLDQIMKDSYRGCIEDRKEIAEIIRRIGSLTLAELINITDAKCADMVMTMASAILQEEYALDIEESEMKTVSFMELLCMIDRTEGSTSGYSNVRRKKYHYPDNLMKEPFRYVCMDLTSYIFEETAKMNNLFRMFWAISTRELFEYLDKTDGSVRQEVECDGKPFKERKAEFYEMAENLKMEIAERDSIGDVIGKAKEIKTKGWNPGTPLNVFKKQVLEAYEILDTLLIDCFRYAYPKQFQLEYVFDTYNSWFIREEEYEWQIS